MAAAAGAGLGLVSGMINQNQKKAEYNRQKELAARTAELSPWTGMQAEMPKSDPNAFGSLMSGAIGGGMMGQNIGSMMGGKSEGPLAGGMAGGMEDSPWAQMMKKKQDPMQGIGQGYGTMMS